MDPESIVLAKGLIVLAVRYALLWHTRRERPERQHILQRVSERKDVSLLHSHKEVVRASTSRVLTA